MKANPQTQYLLEVASQILKFSVSLHQCANTVQLFFIRVAKNQLAKKTYRHSSVVPFQYKKYVQKDRIAVQGNLFGGIETVLGNAKENYCAAVDASGGAESWDKAPTLQALMKQSVRDAKAPIFFFQAENDFNLSPSKTLSEEMKAEGKSYEMKIYPAFGKTPKNGHSFAYAGSATWFNDVFAFVTKNCPEQKSKK